MLKRIPVSAGLTALVLIGALCACGSAGTHSVSAGAGATPSRSTSAAPSSPAAPSAPGHHSSPAPVSGAPIIFAVRLGRGFQPSTLRISPGQQFVVIVESSVRSSGPAVPSSCSSTPARIDGGMLTVRCVSGDFYYTAQHPGAAELMATVRPNCARGSLCPQWVAEATFKVTIL